MHPVPSASRLLVNRLVAAPMGGAQTDYVRSYLTLVKPRVVALVLFTAVVACFAAAGGSPPPSVVLTLLASGFLSAGGAAVLNHYLDRDIDAEMERTRQRPLAAGRIHRPALVVLGGLAMVVVGVSWGSTVNLMLAFIEMAGAFVYVVIYSLWLKRRTPLNIVIGGLAGSLAVLGGWAAVDPGLALAPWPMGAVVFVWTPAHFWSLALARRTEYARARIPMLPVVTGAPQTAWWILGHIIATVGCSLWAGVAAALGPLYFSIALSAGAYFVLLGIRLVAKPNVVNSWQAFKYSGGYLGMLFLSILIDILVRAA